MLGYVDHCHCVGILAIMFFSALSKAVIVDKHCNSAEAFFMKCLFKGPNRNHCGRLSIELLSFHSERYNTELPWQLNMLSSVLQIFC